MMHTKNRVLLSLPAEARRVVLDQCERVDLTLGTILARVGETTDAVQFPETAVISTVATYRDGSTIEMGTIGREACTGVALTLGQPRQLSTNEVQIAGVALEMPAKSFAALKASLPQFERSLFSTVQAVLYQVMVSGASTERTAPNSASPAGC